ncbi:urease accessory protein [Variovorax sp. WS11]|uniref:HupE/UreJ family protein n=1 Tax=Variovorax sp. WS11 TaxID=1105204 RepID=UPI000D0D795F|nr:HupE/UreJ family protein [Variovorax sp. WS11]NDZ12747.1 urease accessory protein [Variovorax sp. WS11]PSL84685.1 urease accessory protein [Variovorax sp. WS11]
MQRSEFYIRFLVFAALAIGAVPAWAHAGHADIEGFVHAAMHPWTGVDHVLAALACGMVGAHVGGRAGATVLCAYIAGLVAGSLLNGSGPAWLVEVALGLSVATIGVLLLRPAMTGARFAVATAAGFAVFHGFAHQMEVGGQAPFFATAAGFTLSTGVLLLAGFGLQRALRVLGVARGAVAWPLAATGALLVLRSY